LNTSVGGGLDSYYILFCEQHDCKDVLLEDSVWVESLILPPYPFAFMREPPNI
jgi:hypothetical protein